MMAVIVEKQTGHTRTSAPRCPWHPAMFGDELLTEKPFASLEPVSAARRERFGVRIARGARTGV